MTESVKLIHMIKTALEQGVKTYSVYDGSSRLVGFYEAPSDATNGTNCLLTEYGYVGASSRVEKTRESIAQWNSAYDLP